MLGVSGERLHRVDGRAKEEPVEELLMRERDRPQLRGQCEREQEVGHGQEALPLTLDPGGDVGVLALRTVAVATGVVAVAGDVATITDVDVSPARRRAARGDVVHRPAMAGQNGVADALAVRSGVPDDDVGQLDGHDGGRRSEPHEAVDLVNCPGRGLLGEVGVDGGGRRRAVPEVPPG
jgi:hypothetical protein